MFRTFKNVFKPRNLKNIQTTFNLFAPKQINAKTLTTGWTDSSRNEFHPGDVITILRNDFTGYSPHKGLGAIELAVHRTGEGREFCQPHITPDGKVSGFFFNVLPRWRLMRNDLRAEFTQLAAFADSLSKRNLQEIFASKKKTASLIREIENKFGKAITIKPKLIEQNRSKPKMN